MNLETLKKELTYKAVRSGKPGGQHVNKVATKIQISLDIYKSKAFTEQEKMLITGKLYNRISKAGILTIEVETYRSQFMNKKAAWEALVMLITKSLQKPEKRIATKPKKSAILKRLHKKKLHSLKKQNRRKNF